MSTTSNIRFREGNQYNVPTSQIVLMVALTLYGFALIQFENLMSNNLQLFLTVVILIIVSSNRKAGLAILIAWCPWVSRVSFDFLNYNIRIEMLVGILALLRILFNSNKKYSQRNLSLVTILVSVWIVFQFFINAIFAVNISKSNAILIWLVLGLCMTIYIRNMGNRSIKILTNSLYFSMINSVASIIVWLAVSSGNLNTGFQIDPIYGDVAIYVAAFEANIFAGLIAIWSIVAMTKYGSLVSNKVRISIIVLAPIVCVLAATRTAIAVWAFAITVLLFQNRNLRLFFTMISTLSVSVITYLAVNYNNRITVSNKYISVFSSFGEALYYRFYTWTLAIQDLSIGSFLLHGYGMNSFPDMHPDPTQKDLGLGRFLGNILLQILHSGGLISFSLILLATVILLNYRKSKESLVVFLSYFALSLGTSTLWLAQTWILLGLALALPVESSKSLDEQKSKSINVQ